MTKNMAKHVTKNVAKHTAKHMTKHVTKHKNDKKYDKLRFILDPECGSKSTLPQGPRSRRVHPPILPFITANLKTVWSSAMFYLWGDGVDWV